MKRLFIAVLLFLVLGISSLVMAASGFYGAVAISGGTTGAMDNIDGADLSDGDVCSVITSSGFYNYRLDASSGAAEDLVNNTVISPDDNAGNKRWLLSTLVGDNVKIADRGVTVGSGTGITVNTVANVNTQAYKVTTTYAAYSDTDTTGSVVLCTLPAKTKIIGFYADTTVAYTGGAVSATTLRVGITAEDAAEIIADHDVLTAAVTSGLADADMGTGLTRAAAIQGGYLPSWSGTTAIYATINTTTANTDALTAGSTTFYIQTERY